MFVPKLEADAYRAGGARNVVEVPDQIRGITATRNWILDHAGTDRVVMIDDDLKYAGWIKVYDRHMERQALNEAQFLDEWRKLFELTEQLGYRIWGAATDGAPRSVYPYKPFLWKTYVTASCMGIVNSGLRFDESFAVKEDYELCLRAIQEDGGLVGARNIVWVNAHWHDEGGCKDYRTQALEEQCTNKLIRKFPGRVRRAPNTYSRHCIKLEF